MPAMAPRSPYSFAGPLLPLRRHFSAPWRHDFTAPPPGPGVAVARRIAAPPQPPPLPTPHPPLDEALPLHAASPPGASAGQYQGATHAGYWNMGGPFGGVTAATMLQAIAQHPQRLGDPLSLTVNFAGALVAGPFTVQAQPVRTNRSTQHWTLAIVQAGADGVQQVTTSATAVTALRRETWSVGDVPMPQVPAPAGQPAIPSGFGVEWLNR